MTRFKPGDRVIAYGKYPGTIVKPVAFSAYEVKTDLVSVPNRKRRKRLDLTVAESNLAPEGSK